MKKTNIFAKATALALASVMAFAPLTAFAEEVEVVAVEGGEIVEADANLVIEELEGEAVELEGEAVELDSLEVAEVEVEGEEALFSSGEDELVGINQDNSDYGPEYFGETIQWRTGMWGYGKQEEFWPGEISLDIDPYDHDYVVEGVTINPKNATRAFKANSLTFYFVDTPLGLTAIARGTARDSYLDPEHRNNGKYKFEADGKVIMPEVLIVDFDIKNNDLVYLVSSKSFDNLKIEYIAPNTKFEKCEGGVNYCCNQSVEKFITGSGVTLFNENTSFDFSCRPNLKYLDLSGLDLKNIVRITDKDYFYEWFEYRVYGGKHESKFNADTMLTPINAPDTAPIPLPYTMYDENGKGYDNLPCLPYSIKLTKAKPNNADPGNNNNPTPNPNPNPSPVALPFTDLKAGSWYTNAVEYVYKNGIMSGTSTTTFAPNASTTRAMMVTILYRAAGSPSVDGVANPFSDVKEGSWYTDAVKWAYSTGVTTGYGNGLFGTNDPVKREQMATFLQRFAGLKGSDTAARADLTGFSDVGSISSYAVEAMSWAKAHKIINGKTTTTLAPKGNATRAEVAQMIMNFNNEF